MKTQPPVSVIVPVYAVEAYIAQCAESLMVQTYPAIEFIFVNDGTPDRSMEVLDAVLKRYPQRTVKIVNEENAGLPHARAAGLKVATGEYILHVDSDDWVEPDEVERLVARAEETGADLVLATDPDADRLGVRVRDKDGIYHTLTGNMSGNLT